jgi:hypothetical protein
MNDRVDVPLSTEQPRDTDGDIDADGDADDPVEGAGDLPGDVPNDDLDDPDDPDDVTGLLTDTNVDAKVVDIDDEVVHG